MSRTSIMPLLARWHIWLGWVIGAPLLLWTVTGLVMAARPIEAVRGDDLRAKPVAVDPAGLVFPVLTARIENARLVQQPDGPVWIVTEQVGGTYRYSARDGSAISPVIETDARALALAAYGGKGTLEAVSYIPAERAPRELGPKSESWRAQFSDGTRIYLDVRTGEVLAMRTHWWRIHDVMRGLHVMDLQTRETISHPLLIVLAAAAAIGTAISCILLFRRRKTGVAP